MADAYRYKAPPVWNKDEALKLAARAVEAERIGYDGARLQIVGDMVEIPRKVQNAERGIEVRRKITAALEQGPATVAEICRRAKLTYGQVNYQLHKLEERGLVYLTLKGWQLTKAGAQGREGTG
jgi:DNA-binding transcriptional ArsR family regulator